MKILRSKAIDIAGAWNNLKNTPPKEFMTIDDMEKSVKICQKMELAVPEFAKHIKDGQEFHSKVKAGEIKSNGEDGKKNNIIQAYEEYDKSSEKLARDVGEKIVEIEFEDAEFNSFFQFVSKWGKTWFSKTEEYLNFLNDMNETNKQPKVKEKK